MIANKHTLVVRRRLNKNVDGKLYWKWYVDIPSKIIKKLGVKVGDVVTLSKFQRPSKGVIKIHERQ